MDWITSLIPVLFCVFSQISYAQGNNNTTIVEASQSSSIFESMFVTSSIDNMMSTSSSFEVPSSSSTSSPTSSSPPISSSTSMTPEASSSSTLPPTSSSRPTSPTTSMTPNTASSSSSLLHSLSSAPMTPKSSTSSQISTSQSATSSSSSPIALPTVSSAASLSSTEIVPNSSPSMASSSSTVHQTASSPMPSPATTQIARSSQTTATGATVTPATAPTTRPMTQPGSKKYTFSFKILNRVCTLGIRENNMKSSDYQNLAKIVLDAVNNAYRNDSYYRGSRILYFDCGSVIPVVEISKNGSASDNVVNELKPVSDLVATGLVANLQVDKGSFSSNPTKSVPTLYVKLTTELSNMQFCGHKSNFKERFATFLVTTDGLSLIDPSQIIIFDHKCNDKSAEYSSAEALFYITSSSSDAVIPDKELTTRAYKLIQQFVQDGTTWRLSASFDGKVKSVELTGKDKVEETAYSEMTIVLIGMGVTFGLLLLIVIIIVIVIQLRNKKNNDRPGAMTIQNQTYGAEDKNYQYASINDGYMKDGINIDGHDYEYPLAPNEEKRAQPKQQAYQELQMTSHDKPAPSQYQTLSAEDEERTKVIIEPEESTGYSVSVSAFKPEAKDLSAIELAQRKDREDQMKLEFESLEYDMPSSNIYSSSLMTKNRLSTIIPRPETRVVLMGEEDNPDSDYINASYVKDTHLNKKYILTQGPLQKTADDFWRMVVEQNISVIVMVTPLVQEGMEKCFQYWPPDSVPRRFGSTEVHLSKKELKPDFTVTTMGIKTGEQQRDVVLFRYMSWPENDVPENPKSFVNFLLEAIKANQAKEDSKLVAHCSNGVGVSAIFAAVANGIESFNEKKVVDVYSIVKGLRKDRAGAIQHFDQYKFVYQALYEYTLKFQDSNDPFANQSNVTSAF